MAEGLDEELNARAEELAFRQQEARRQKQEAQRQKLQQALRVLAKATGTPRAQLKRQAVKVAARAIATTVLPVLWSAFLAALPFLLIGALVFLVVVGAIYIICNPSEGGILGYTASAANYLTGIVPQEVCDAFSGFSGVVTVLEKGQTIMCNNPKIIAEQNNAAYPYNQESQELKRLMSCIENHPAIRGKNFGSKFTWEQRDPDEPESQSFCNYTRGVPIPSCGVNDCAHKPNSCHYGGRNGSQGAEAVDYGNEAIASELIQAAQACGAGFWLNEGDHVHISTKACLGDGGDS